MPKGGRLRETAFNPTLFLHRTKLRWDAVRARPCTSQRTGLFDRIYFQKSARGVTCLPSASSCSVVVAGCWSLLDASILFDMHET